MRFKLFHYLASARAGIHKMCVGHYEFNPFPGCNQIIVSNHVFIEPKYRNQGIGKKSALERVEHAQELGYDYMLCTVIACNKAEIKCLEHAGWKPLDFFINKETGHRVNIYGRKTCLEEPSV